MECFGEILDMVRRQTPVVHSITNYVTVNDCANMILAAGGSPIMADDAAEVEQIVALSSALVLNIGTLNARTVESMLAAGKRANALNIPVVLDPVGAGASDLRNETLRKLLQEVRFAVIRATALKSAFSRAKRPRRAAWTRIRTLWFRKTTLPLPPAWPQISAPPPALL